VEAGDRLTVEVLGPIHVRDGDGTDRTPDGPLRRRLLALLVLRRGHVVSTATAVDTLWPEGGPRDPVAALQNHVSRLRQSLPGGAIASAPDGYCLDPRSVAVDADRLPLLLERLGSGGGADLDAELDDLLDRWRGPAYVELDDSDDGRAEAERLDQLRLRLLEARAERRLSTGRLDGLVADLTALIGEAPLRETPRSLLMAALSASGRRVEALRVYDDFRRLLAEDLGIEPSGLLQAQHAELLGTAPAASPVPDRLPAPTGELLGREELVEESLRCIAAHRAVTLVGPGGVGKTRLLVEIAHRVAASDPPRAVVLAELAASDSATAADAVASALGIDARPGVAPVERIASVVGSRPMVLLLDNCEHVLDAVGDLVERVLAACPGVRIVATSRERLRVPGEAVCRVPTLDVEGATSSAVQLFLERADAVTSEVRDDDLPTVAEIVRRLDGLPLAIELAAARLHTHDLAEVSAGLDHRFTMLSAGYRTSSRHGSLHAAITWSFDLLDVRLRQVLVDLAVFSGPFTIDAAAAVCGLDPDETADALAQLAERSLVGRTSDRRHTLLETLRAFGEEQLEASGRAEVVGRRHAHHQVAWLTEMGDRLGEVGAGVLPAIDERLPELRAALAWLLEHDELESAGQLVAGINDYGFFRLRPDVLAWSEQMIAADPAGMGPQAPMVWVVGAYAAWMIGDLATHDARAGQALQIAGGPDADLHPEVATVRGNCDLFAGRLREAVVWYRRAVEAAGTDSVRRTFARGTELLAMGYADHPQAAAMAEDVLAEVGEPPTPAVAYAWYCAGEAVAERDPSLARRRHARAIELAGECGTTTVTGLAGASKASLDARHGNPVEAADAYRWLLEHWRRAGMWSTQWTMLRSVAALLARLGRPVEAATLEGAVRSTAAGHRIFGADAIALDELGHGLRVELGAASYDRARACGAQLDGDGAVELALQSL
jgi:predicted ATPase/DNA-binding SARP family transcriptional activator